MGNRSAHAFLDGVTAGVVGLIAATSIGLFRSAITDLRALGIFVAALLALYLWKSKICIAVVMLAAGLSGLLLFPL